MYDVQCEIWPGGVDFAAMYYFPLSTYVVATLPIRCTKGRKIEENNLRTIIASVSGSFRLLGFRTVGSEPARSMGCIQNRQASHKARYLCGVKQFVLTWGIMMIHLNIRNCKVIHSPLTKSWLGITNLQLQLSVKRLSRLERYRDRYPTYPESNYWVTPCNHLRSDVLH